MHIASNNYVDINLFWKHLQYLQLIFNPKCMENEFYKELLKYAER